MLVISEPSQKDTYGKICRPVLRETRSAHLNLSSRRQGPARALSMRNVLQQALSAGQRRSTVYLGRQKVS